MNLWKILEYNMVCSFVEPDKIKEWIKICQLMKTLDKSVCFKFTPTELTIQMIHPSKMSVLDMIFPNHWFSNYNWEESEIYISTDSLFTIFSLYSGENMISMECDKKFMNLKFFHDSQTKNFSIPLHNHTHKDILIEIEKGVQISIDSTYFYSLCEELYKFGDLLYFNIRKDFFHMFSYGNEKMVVDINPSKIDIMQEGENDQSFKLIYLLMFLKFSVVYPKVVVNINKILHITVEKEYILNYYLSPSLS